MVKPNSAVPSPRSPELFAGLPPSACQSILSTSNEEVFSSGQQIFRQGEPKQKIFLLKQGLVKVSQFNQRGDEAILWLNVAGEIIGSLNYLTPTYCSSALTVQPCKVMMWRLPAFEAILDRFPLLLRNVALIMARQTAELSSRIFELTTASAGVCLAHALIRMTDKIGRRVDDHYEVDLTQETLALMVGTTLYYVSHLLSIWERQGLLVPGRCRIVIRDLPGLKDFARKSTDRLTQELTRPREFRNEGHLEHL